MTIDEINSATIQNIERYYRTRRDTIKNMQERYELDKGAIPVYNRKFVIDGQVQGDLVNYPVHVDFLGNIVNTKIGYLFGNPVQIISESAQEFIDDFTKRVYFEDILAEIGTYAAVGGFGAMLLYNNTKGQAGVMSVDPYSCVFIGDDILNPDLAMRFYNQEEIVADNVEVYRYVEVYDKAEYAIYKTRKIVTDSENINDDNIDKSWELVQESTTHMFEDIPLIAFKNNDNLKGDCENVIDAMDAYDRAITDELCDIEQYRLDYLVLKGDLGNDAEKEAQKLKRMRIMYLKNSSDGTNNSDAYFITRMMPLEAVNATLDRTKKEIYEIARHLNVADDTIGGNLSGVALRNKQLPFEFKCLETEREFKASLTKMFKLLSAYWDGKIDYLDIDYIFTRNYANNKLEESEFLRNLNGIVPPEILFPLAALEIDMDEFSKLKEEKEQSEIDRIQAELDREKEEEVIEPV